MTVVEYKKIWKTIIAIEQGPLTTDRLLTAVKTQVKNAGTDAMAQGLVITMSFPKTGTLERDSVSFLICIAEFIDFEHTKRGEDVMSNF